ncbi:PAS domain-containing protein [Phenylobacterium immobile]|uniref:PAS domain-containing protein n=1 Tax=Phenylobacterium immobile TaxID=21 RepID=UPI000B2A826E|nr:PAS domain-containing protein [Phenylobacterium immobile]
MPLTPFDPKAADAGRALTALQQMPGFVAVLAGPDHRFEYVNDAYLALTGDRDLIGRPVREVFPELEGQGYFDLLDQVFQTGQPFNALARPVRMGSHVAPRHVDFLYQALRDSAGAVTGVFVGGYDVTAAVQAQQRLAALAELSDILRELDDPAALPHAVCEILGRNLGVDRVGYGVIDDEAETLHVDRDWTAPGVDSLAGVTRLRDYGSFIESLRRNEFIAICDVREDPRTAASAAALEGRSARSFVNVPVVERGRLVAVLFVNHGTVRDWGADELSLIRDVAERTFAAVERYRSSAALRASETRYRTLFEAVDVGFCVVEMKFDETGSPIDYRLVEINPAFERQTGLHGAAGGWVSEVAPGLERHWFETYGRVARTGEAVRFENQAIPFGRWYDVHAFPAGEPGQNRVAILFNDITERRAAETAMLNLNAQLETRAAERLAERDQLWALSQDMLARADFTGMMISVNPAWSHVLGWSEQELLSRGYATFMHPEDEGPTLDALARMGASGQPTRFENRIATADGGWRWIEWVVTPESDGVNFIANGRDISEAKAREAQLTAARAALRESQKMEAMGQLTGGVAHDFNNLLTPIIGSLDMLQRHSVGGAREQRLIGGALQSAERAKTLVQRLLAFARRQPLQPTAVDVGALVRGMSDLIVSTSGPNVQVRADIHPVLPAAKADPNQLEMAVLNLAVNARDAMPTGGVLTISADEPGQLAARPESLAPGRFLRLCIADTGVGMDQETLRRATEPFFSTKGVGKGTGLGLSMVHGLASQLGGVLAIASAPQAGTRVELWLPVADEAPAPAEVAPDIGEGIWAGRVLLVDDEEVVRASTADMLIDLGYQVVEAASAEEALAMMERGQAFDLVLTDHLMPGLSGADLAIQVRARWPGRIVLLISGFAEAESLSADLPILTKPFRQSELARTLHELSTVGRRA